MMKRLSYSFAVLAVAGLILAACGGAPATSVPATSAPATAAPVSGVPEICKTDAFGCAVIKPGETIKIGMGAPHDRRQRRLRHDISQGAKIAVSDAGEFDGFSVRAGRRR